MMYTMYNTNQRVASFTYENGVITAFIPATSKLLPIQIRDASADGFTQWLRTRTIDLNTPVHRRLVHELLGIRDKTAVAIMTCMFSVSDTFTCFPDGEFIPRDERCRAEDQDNGSNFILLSGDISSLNLRIATPCWPTAGILLIISTPEAVALASSRVTL